MNRNLLYAAGLLTIVFFNNIICNYAEPCRFSIKRRGTMAVEGTKIKEMMEGKTLEKDNIKKMYDMVQNASEPEEKKKVMKHSLFLTM